MKGLFKVVLVFGLVVTIVLGGVSGVFADEVKYEYFDDGGADGSVQRPYSPSYICGQTFTPQVDHTITKVGMRLRNKGNPPDYYTVEIRTTYNDVPTEVVSANGTFATENITFDHPGEMFYVDLDNTANLVTDTKYALIVIPQSTGDMNNTVMWYIDDTSATYTRGNKVCTNGNPNEWTEYEGQDADFEEWGIEFSVEAPTISTMPAENITYNEIFDWWEATICGNVTDDGGEACNVGFYYREVSDNWSWGGVSGTYSTNETFSLDLTVLEEDTNYEFYAYGYNSEGSDNGTIEDFWTQKEDDVPDVITYGYPMVKEETQVRLYGKVKWDGNSECTGWFQYKEKGAGEWSASGNVTGLESGDGFDKWVTGLTEEQDYEFRAVAENEIGIGYGAIGEFTLYPDIAIPEVETWKANYITSTEARLWAKTIDDGGMPCISDFQYKKVGGANWMVTGKFYTTTSENWSMGIENLSPETSYEYRARLKNEAGFGYGEKRMFATYETIRTPVMETKPAEWVDAYTFRLCGEITYDGGSACQMWFQWRRVNSGNWSATDRAHGVTTGYELETLVFDLEPEVYYEFRVVALNDVGMGYGKVLEFCTTEEEGGVPPEHPGESPVAKAERFLEKYGLGNQIGHWLVVIGLMAVGFMLFFKSSVMRVVIPLCVFGGAIVVGWIDLWVVVLLALSAGVSLFSILRKRTQGGGD